LFLFSVLGEGTATEREMDVSGGRLCQYAVSQPSAVSGCRQFRLQWPRYSVLILEAARVCSDMIPNKGCFVSVLFCLVLFIKCAAVNRPGALLLGQRSLLLHAKSNS
jgi:hypothetical protein